MKLLFKTSDQDEIEHVKMLFDSKGIPVFVGNEGTARNLGGMSPVGKYQLWVALNEHYEDAVALLENEDHEVLNPVDVQDYYAEAEAVKKRSTEYFFNKMMLVLVLSGGIGFAYYLYSTITGS